MPPRPPRSRALPAEFTVEVGLDEVDDASLLRRRAARALGRSAESLPVLVVRKRSLDARGGRIRFHVVLSAAPAATPELAAPAPREVDHPERVLVVGDGPAGLFAAYELARAGIGCTVLERGKEVQPRRRDLKGLNRHGVVDRDSNYCFGEGGAGTYSDGKLYTRSHQRDAVRDVLEILALHGAPPEILIDARPHIGSSRLPKVVSSLREHLVGLGVQFRFGARVVGLVVSGQVSRRVTGLRLADGTSLDAERVILATGHSARDVHLFLLEAGATLTPKAFAMGVRVEHPQPLIDGIRYRRHAGDPRLPAAAYAVAEQVEGRGVYSFCMCPGGWVVPASTEPEGLVVNGMSLRRRGSPFANAGLVVSIELEDVARAGEGGPLGGVALQRRLEQAAREAGGALLEAPATRVTDFVAGRASSTVPESSYVPGLVPTDVGAVLDRSGLPLAARLRAGLRGFERSLRGFLTEEAVLIGVESRTSSPVRVERDPDTLEARGLAALYPAGEGSGYAGGIVTAAVDGARVARAVAASLAAR